MYYHINNINNQFSYHINNQILIRFLKQNQTDESNESKESGEEEADNDDEDSNVKIDVEVLSDEQPIIRGQHTLVGIPIHFKSSLGTQRFFLPFSIFHKIGIILEMLISNLIFA